MPDDALAPADTDAGTAPARLGDPRWRGLTVGLVFTITLVASESLAVATILPSISDDLSGIRLYGWVFSAFFLGTLIGIVVAGALADERGPAFPFALGLALFSAGLAIGGLAPAMWVLVLARAIQGVGAGAIPAIAYAAIGRSYPEVLRPRMFAVLSTAWVVPGLVGPAASGLVADHLGWRWVFLGLLPLVVLAAAIAIPALRRIGPPETPTAATGLRDAALVAVGAGLLLGGLGGGSLLALPPLVVAGVAVALPPFRRLTPPGTLRAAAGLPATILARGVLTFAFFGADSYVPLTITDVRGHSATVAGLALTATTLTWTAGSWTQARVGARWGAPRIVRRGMVLVGVGIVGMLLVALTGAPLAPLLVVWAVAGLGMGLAYPTISVTMLRLAPPGREGSTAAALQLADNVGVALGAGFGGAAVAAGEVLSWAPESGIAIAFVLALAAAAAGVVLSTRVPAAPQTGS